MAYNKSQIMTSAVPTVGSVSKMTQVFQDATFRGTDFQIFEGKLYIGSYTEGFRIYDISDVTNPVHLATYPLVPRVSWQADCNVARFGDRVILSFGLDDEDPEGAHTEFFDVTDPLNIKPLVEFHGGAHTTDINGERRLFFPMGGHNRAFLLVGDYPSESIQKAIEPNRLFEIYDVSPVLENPPREPQILFWGIPSQMWNNSKFRTTPEVPESFSHLHECELYLNFNNSGKDILVLCEAPAQVSGAVYIIDVTNPKSPVVINRITDPRALTLYYREALFMKGDNSYLFVDDEPFYPEGYREASIDRNDDGGLMLFKMTEGLKEATLVSEYHLKRLGNEAGVVFTHMWDSSNRMCVVSCFGGGTRLVSYKDPANPVEVAHYAPIGSQAWRAAFHDGHIIISDSFRGLEVIKYTPFDSVTSTAAIIGGLAVAPSTRMGATMAYNGKWQKGAVLFGGRNDSQYLADTWVWDGNSWTRKIPDSAVNIPGRRMLQGMQTIHGVPVMFCGRNATADLSDSYYWDGLAWNSVSSSAPSARHGMATCGAPNVAPVLSASDGNIYTFGGRKFADGKTMPSTLAGVVADSDFFSATGDTVHGDMWKCYVKEQFPQPTTVTWSQVTPTNPPPARFGAAMAYNFSTNKVIMFGGVDASGNVLSDTWEYDPATNAWTQISTAPSKTPTGRVYHAMHGHQISGQIVLHGGYDASKNLLTDTWVWNERKRGWCQQTKGSGLKPSAPFPAMAYDLTSDDILLMGQSDESKLYAWGGTEWRVVEPTY